MKIHTLGDWNLILEGCGCCPMPECPVPTRECEEKSATVDDCSRGQAQEDPPPEGVGYGCWVQWTRPTGEDSDLIPLVYRKSTFTIIEEYVDGDASYSCGAETIEITFDGGGEWAVTLGDSKSQASYLDDALADLNEDEWSGSGSCFSSLSVEWPTIGSYDWDLSCENVYLGHAIGPDPRTFNFSMSVKKSRFRWLIPDTHEGSYFKITWDEVFFPADESTPTVVNADKTWTWEGPGDPEDEDTWRSGWYELAPPATPGQVRVVNVRFVCYKSAKFGVRPQTTGEAYDIPEP